MTYRDFIFDQIKKRTAGEPIYTADISAKLAEKYGLAFKEAAAATAVVFKRLVDGKNNLFLRFYQKGIYYRTVMTAFGEMGINKEKLIADKYLLPHNGYETGFSVLHRLGLTSQMAQERCIVTNRAGACARTDAKLDVIIRPPKTKVNKENKGYLQFLDTLELMDKAPIDAECPYAILAEHIQNNNLQYERLLFLADRYYNKKAIMQIAHIASQGKNKRECKDRDAR